MRVADWLNVAALALCVFLLVSFAVLPESRSHRHYLSTGLVLSVIMVQLAFIIPLGTKPDVCANSITPADMHTSTSCAWSGALLLAGGMGTVVWVLLRSLWTHLRVCWDRKPSDHYFWVSQLIGIGLPAVFLVAALSATGVSYRAGNACLPNRPNSFADFWGWLVAFSGLSTIVQFSTTGFCLWVYLGNLYAGNSMLGFGRSTNAGLLAQNLDVCIRTELKRQAWQRVRNAFMLQCRSIVMSMLVIIESVYFATVFLQQQMVTMTTVGPAVEEKIRMWTECIVLQGGDKNKCLSLAKGLTSSEEVVVASVILVSVIAIECFFLLGRLSMFKGWRNIFRHRKTGNDNPDTFLMVAPGLHSSSSYSSNPQSNNNGVVVHKIAPARTTQKLRSIGSAWERIGARRAAASHLDAARSDDQITSDSSKAGFRAME
ncbi:hypothetical protein B0A49_13363 [Cryomyces minteri]|uniref:G-protein coupled receptors family 2 profile 2 domain-containing protein n=1 Tax=Cryomyces minteri TaxID=331657 RepID=A0A4U0VAY1_9PEZI|nr:hypothetical protein B0A49_13363 [Cryomyces minteri]